MAFIPGMPRKAFLIESLADAERTPQKALVEPYDEPNFRGLDDELRTLYVENDIDVDREGVKLTMPDGSEWYVSEGTLDEVLEAVRESRRYLAGKAAE